jgi:tripartite-type tricarboxylate transporter receptor subunit TctC
MKLWTILVALTAILSGVAQAQVYPTRPITLVVPYPPGGPTDTLARILAEHMRGTLGQTVVVENVTGAGGTIGVGRVARASGDGYTLAIGQVATNAFNGATYQLPYDLLKDLVPVALLTTARHAGEPSKFGSRIRS